jgi:hypothetical protein
VVAKVEEMFMKNLEILSSLLTISRGRYENACREYVISVPMQPRRTRDLDEIKEKALGEMVAIEKRAGDLVKRAHEIEEFEKRTGIEYDAMGPNIAICGECGQTFQYMANHDCRGKVTLHETNAMSYLRSRS